MFLTPEAWNAALEEINSRQQWHLENLGSGGCGAPEKYYRTVGNLEGMKFVLEVLKDYSERQYGRRKKTQPLEENDDAGNADGSSV